MRKLKYCFLKYHFFLCEIKGRMWDRNIISETPKELLCIINTHIFNMAGDLWPRWRVLLVELPWTSLHMSPLYQLVPQHPAFVIYVIKDRNVPPGRLWELAALDRIQIFIMTAAKPKQNFSRVKRNMQNSLILPLEWRESGVWWRLQCFCLGG